MKKKLISLKYWESIPYFSYCYLHQRFSFEELIYNKDALIRDENILRSIRFEPIQSKQQRGEKDYVDAINDKTSKSSVWNGLTHNGLIYDHCVYIVWFANGKIDKHDCVL